MPETLLKIQTRIFTNRLIVFLKKIPFIGLFFKKKSLNQYEHKTSFELVMMFFQFLNILVRKVLYLVFIYFIASGLEEVLESISFFQGLPSETYWLAIWISFLSWGFFSNIPSKNDPLAKTLLKGFRVDFAGYYRFRLFEKLLDRLIYMLLLFIALKLMNFSFVMYQIVGTMVFSVAVLSEVFALKQIEHDYKLSPRAEILLAFLLPLIHVFLIVFLPYKKVYFLLSSVLFLLSVFYIFKYRQLSTWGKIERTAIQNMHDLDTILQNAEDANVKNLEVDKDIQISNFNYHGQNYYHHLFLDRHRNLWLKPLKRASTVITLVFNILSILLFILKIKVPEKLLTIDWYGAFATLLSFYTIYFYFSNLSEKMTKVYYLHGDYDLLHYAFYRNKHTLWKQFLLRFKSILMMNFIPVAVSMLFLLMWKLFVLSSMPTALFIRALLGLCVLVIFMSLHYLLMYYLLQPFTKKLNIHSKIYAILNLGVYLFVFNTKSEWMNPSFLKTFGMFTFFYLVAGTYLVYRFSEKTFVWKD